MDKLNCLGDYCPIPMIKLKNKLNSVAHGEEFMIVIDHSCVLEELKLFISKQKHEASIDEVMNGVWEIQITKH